MSNVDFCNLFKILKFVLKITKKNDIMYYFSNIFLFKFKYVQLTFLKQVFICTLCGFEKKFGEFTIRTRNYYVNGCVDTSAEFVSCLYFYLINSCAVSSWFSRRCFRWFSWCWGWGFNLWFRFWLFTRYNVNACFLIVFTFVEPSWYVKTILISRLNLCF